MEEEIDSIFLGTSESAPADSLKIERLRACVEALPRLGPYLDLVHSDVEGIRKHLAVYDIQLRSLAADLDEIQRRNQLIEEHNKHENAIYEHLKSLCIALTVDDEHFKILENGSFIDMADLAKMEKSIGIIGSTDLRRYTIRVVQSNVEQIRRAQRNFLKRFVAFLDKLLVEPQSAGELRVHKSLYQLVYRYKFIYRFGRQFDEFYPVMCHAYENHSKSVYEREFEKYLDGISDLIDDARKLSLAIGVLLRSYECLIDSEANFKRRMDADFSTAQIFRDTSEVIIEFIGDMFRRSKLVTLTSVGIVLSGPESQVAEFEAFRGELLRRYRVLEELFLKSERGAEVSWGKISDMNAMLGASCFETLKDGLLRAYTYKLAKDAQDGSTKQYLASMQLLHSIASDSPMVRDTLEQMKDGLPQRIIHHVFASGDECSNTAQTLEMLDPQKSGYGATVRLLHDVIVANAEGELRGRLDELFAQNTAVDSQ